MRLPFLTSTHVRERSSPTKNGILMRSFSHERTCMTSGFPAKSGLFDVSAATVPANALPHSFSSCDQKESAGEITCWATDAGGIRMQRKNAARKLAADRKVGLIGVLNITRKR